MPSATEPDGPGPRDADVILHASCVTAGGHAVLIKGPSGSGKSGLALQLLAFGATLVSDDRTRVWVEHGNLMADVPNGLRGLIEAREVGILTVAAPAPGPVHVTLVVDMGTLETQRLPPQRHEDILGIRLESVRKSTGPHFPAAIMTYLLGARHA